MISGQPKSILQSKTFWGIVIMAVAPYASRFFGVDVNVSDAEAAQNIADQVITIGGEAFGAMLALWGRMTARQPVRVL